MISYLFLHYNRPYFLELNIKLLRKYIKDTPFEIIVADDGSDKEVINRIKKEMCPDKLFVQKNNFNTTGKGSCSNTILGGRALCKGDYLVFAEDDFLFFPSEITDMTFHKNEELMPRCYYNKDLDSSDIFSSSINILNSNRDIKNVQLARDSKRVPTKDPFLSKDGKKWEFVNHKEKGGAYYCNWVNMSRMEDAKRIVIPKDRSIWSLESYLSCEWDRIFGKGDWSVCPERRYFLHIGTAFSKRKDSFSKSAKRIVSSQKLQANAFNEIKTKTLEGFCDLILESWKTRKFYIDFEELINSGLNESFTSAFDRIK